MLFDVCSDIHIKDEKEFQKICFTIENGKKSDTLLIAGDISDDILLSEKIVKNFEKIYSNVFAITGNHDYYLRNIPEVDNYLSNNSNFLTPKYPFKIIDDTVIIGLTGWYDLLCYEDYGINFSKAKETWENLKRDSYWINFDNNKFPWDYAQEQKELLKDLVSFFESNEDIKNIIITTHMIPSKTLVSLRNDEQWDNATPSYVNSTLAEEVINCSTKIKKWIYGHTHDRSVKNYLGVDFINNARGYNFETYGWNLYSFSV